MFIEVGISARQNAAQHRMADMARAWNSPEDEVKGGRLFVLADGTGRANFGRIASEVAIQQIRETFYEKIQESPDAPVGDVLRETLSHANSILYERAEKLIAQGSMKASVIAAVLRGDELAIAWVGNCRAYFLPHGMEVAQQATLNTLHRDGETIVMMGAAPSVEIGTYSVDMDKGDTIILCTDGLYTHATTDELGAIILRHSKMQYAAAELMDNIMEQGNNGENAAVIVIQLRAEPPPPETPPQGQQHKDTVTTLVADLSLDIVSDDTETQEMAVSNVFDDAPTTYETDGDRNEENAPIPPFLAAADEDIIPADDDPFRVETNFSGIVDDTEPTEPVEESAPTPLPDRRAAFKKILHNLSELEEADVRNPQLPPPSITEEELDALFVPDIEPPKTFEETTIEALMAEEQTSYDHGTPSSELSDEADIEKDSALPLNQISTAILLFSGVLLLAALLVLGSAYLMGELRANPDEQLPTVASIARDANSTRAKPSIIITDPDKPTTAPATSPPPTATPVQVDVPNGWVNGTVLYVTGSTGYRRDVFSPPVDATQLERGDPVVVSLARQRIGYREWYDYNGERWWFVDNIGWLSEGELSARPVR